MIANPYVDSSDSPSFRLKGGLFPLTLLELIHCDLAKLREDLMLKVAEAPGFFQQAPTVLSLEHLRADPACLKLSAIRDVCKEFGLVVMALRGADEALSARAHGLGLAILPLARAKKTASQEETAPDHDEAEPSMHKNEAPSADTSEEVSEQSANVVAIDPAPAHTRIITTPVRSGQQIYAAGGDLVVLAAVSAGAEILADGNIHVYGPVRGRVLAGVNGNKQSRIFCQTMEAELVSIAGYFKVNEDLREKHWKQSVQAFLTEETLNIEQLG